MTNVRFPSINDYPDVAAKNFYNLELAKGIDHNEIMQIIYITGRDNARTPMQWDDSLNAGFSTAQQTWIGINPNYVRINVAQQEKDEHSILNFYKHLVRLRKDNDIFVYGIYDLILSSHKQIYGYTRTSDTKRAYILTNLTDRVAQFTLYQGLSSSQLVLSNLIEPVPEHENEKTFKFHPYEIRVYIIDYKKKEHHHHRHKYTINIDADIQAAIPDQLGDSKATLTKRQKAALEKLNQMSNKVEGETAESTQAIIKAVADATTKILAERKPVSERSVSTVEKSDSSDIDLENEPIEKKRERQRSLVLNLENVTPVTPATPSSSDSSNPNPFEQQRRSFSSQTSRKPSFKGHHDDSSSSSSDDETSDTGTKDKDIDYAVLYDDSIEDFSFSSAREQAKKRLLRQQQE